jgi:hypothetical protein
VLLAAVAAGATGVAGAATPATKTCDLTRNAQDLGPSYVTSLKVRGATCATGVQLVRAYYRCRVRSGGVRGKCHSRVLRYVCHEHRQGISIQFDATVTCTRGTSRKIVHTYTQNA